MRKAKLPKKNASCLRPSTTQREGSPVGGTTNHARPPGFCFEKNRSKDPPTRAIKWDNPRYQHNWHLRKIKIWHSINGKMPWKWICLGKVYFPPLFGEQMKHMSIPVWRGFSILSDEQNELLVVGWAVVCLLNLYDDFLILKTKKNVKHVFLQLFFYLVSDQGSARDVMNIAPPNGFCSHDGQAVKKPSGLAIFIPSKPKTLMVHKST